jgi:hypothetical protein
MLPLIALQHSADFEVWWSGVDKGSGIRDYTIFVSENGGPYTAYLRNTTDTLGTFTGEFGKTYAFYSVARDQTGNMENTPMVADAATVMPTAVEESTGGGPAVFELSQNYPNPFNPSTTIRFDVPQPAHVTIKIYDILGREVRTLVNRKFEAGRYVEMWDGRDRHQFPVASGIYMLRMQADKFVSVKKLVLVR